MVKHELLVPAGDMAFLHQAIANGADAVYFAGSKYGARKFANNFSVSNSISNSSFSFNKKSYIW